MTKSFTVPRVFFAYRNGQPRIVTDGLPVDPRNADTATLLRFAAEAARASLIRYCVWNDPNGCYTDSQVKFEFHGYKMPTDEYRKIVRMWIAESAINTDNGNCNRCGAAVGFEYTDASKHRPDCYYIQCGILSNI